MTELKQMSFIGEYECKGTVDAQSSSIRNREISSFQHFKEIKGCQFVPESNAEEKDLFYLCSYVNKAHNIYTDHLYN